MMAAVWSLPTQSANGTNTSSERRRLIKDFVAKVQELISILIKQLQQLAVTKQYLNMRYSNENIF